MEETDEYIKLLVKTYKGTRFLDTEDVRLLINQLFMAACEHADFTDAEKLLKEYGADIDYDKDAETEYGKGRPLFGACQEGQKDVVAWLLEHGAEKFNRCFNIACGNDYLECAKLVYEKGFDLRDAFEYLCRNGNIEGVKWLIENGADIHDGYKPGSNRFSCYNIPIRIVIKEGNMKLLKLLMSYEYADEEKKALFLYACEGYHNLEVI